MSVVALSHKRSYDSFFDGLSSSPTVSSCRIQKRCRLAVSPQKILCNDTRRHLSALDDQQLTRTFSRFPRYSLDDYEASPNKEKIRENEESDQLSNLTSRENSSEANFTNCNGTLVDNKSGIKSRVNETSLFSQSGKVHPCSSLNTNFKTAPFIRRASLKDDPQLLFTLDQVKSIITKALEEKEKSLREEYELRLQELLMEQYQAFVRHTEELIHQKLSKSTFDWYVDKNETYHGLYLSYYCDYCDAVLQHDSESGRRTHNQGRKHKENVRQWYTNWVMENPEEAMKYGAMPHLFPGIMPTPLPGLPGLPIPGLMPGPLPGLLPGPMPVPFLGPPGFPLPSGPFPGVAGGPPPPFNPMGPPGRPPINGPPGSPFPPVSASTLGGLISSTPAGNNPIDQQGNLYSAPSGLIGPGGPTQADASQAPPGMEQNQFRIGQGPPRAPPPGVRPPSSLNLEASGMQGSSGLPHPLGQPIFVPNSNFGPGAPGYQP